MPSDGAEDDSGTPRSRFSWAKYETIDERLERAVRYCRHVGGIRTVFGDHEYQFLHDGESVRCWTTSDENPGWIYVGDEAKSCLRHQLQMGRDVEWVSPGGIDG